MRRLHWALLDHAVSCRACLLRRTACRRVSGRANLFAGAPAWRRLQCRFVHGDHFHWWVRFLRAGHPGQASFWVAALGSHSSWYLAIFESSCWSGPGTAARDLPEAARQRSTSATAAPPVPIGRSSNRASRSRTCAPSGSFFRRSSSRSSHFTVWSRSFREVFEQRIRSRFLGFFPPSPGGARVGERSQCANFPSTRALSSEIGMRRNQPGVALFTFTAVAATLALVTHFVGDHLFHLPSLFRAFALSLLRPHRDRTSAASRHGGLRQRSPGYGLTAYGLLTTTTVSSLDWHGHASQYNGSTYRSRWFVLPRPACLS